MLLIRATAEQVTKHWPLFKGAIARAIPPTEPLSEDLMLRLLMQLLAGRMQLWIAYTRPTWPPEVCGILTTAVFSDPLTVSKGLMLYSVYSFRPLSEVDWKDGFETVAKFAKHEGCTRIFFYTNNENIRELSRKFGFYTEQFFGVLQLA